MDIEKTIEFILEQQAHVEALFQQAEARFRQAEARFQHTEVRFQHTEVRFQRAEVRFQNSERRMDRLERSIEQTSRVVKQLVRFGVSLRSDVRRQDKAIARIAEAQVKTDAKLNALIDIVDKTIRRNGK